MLSVSTVAAGSKLYIIIYFWLTPRVSESFSSRCTTKVSLQSRRLHALPLQLRLKQKQQTYISTCFRSSTLASSWQPDGLRIQASKFGPGQRLQVKPDTSCHTAPKVHRGLPTSCVSACLITLSALTSIGLQEQVLAGI